MSSTSAIQLQLIAQNINTSANVLFLYETIITFSQEIKVIWDRKWTIMTWLYALTRYIVAVGCLLNLFPAAGPLVCKVDIYMETAVELIQFLCLALFSALRVYAILDGGYLIAGSVFALNIVPVGTNMFNTITRPVIANAIVCTVLPGGSHKRNLSCKYTP
ncbi:hypothetical protein BC629DRAFT_566332 [Irpex lacteus]|nr:hypothetical protein BC629DRAFT_566332 [Irpex lacteus]